MRLIVVSLLILLAGFPQVQATDYEWPEPVEYDWPDQPVPEKSWDHVILYFTQGKGCPPCVREETVEFPVLKKSGWKIGSSRTASHIRVIDIHENPECAESYKISVTPTFVLVRIGGGVYTEIGRKTGFVKAKEIGEWSIKLSGSNQSNVRRPYPLRGSNWTGPDGVHQLGSREEAIRHLLYDGEHIGKFTRPQLSKLSLGELRALHSDDHERRVNWSILEN